MVDFIITYDYFSFEMEMPNFGYKAEEYRYGTGGMEKDCALNFQFTNFQFSINFQ